MLCVSHQQGSAKASRGQEGDTCLCTNKTRKRLVPRTEERSNVSKKQRLLELTGIREIEVKIIRYYFMNYKKFRAWGPSSQAWCRGKAGSGPGHDCDLAPVAEKHVCTAGLLGESCTRVSDWLHVSMGQGHVSCFISSSVWISRRLSTSSRNVTSRKASWPKCRLTFPGSSFWCESSSPSAAILLLPSRAQGSSFTRRQRHRQGGPMNAPAGRRPGLQMPQTH